MADERIEHGGTWWRRQDDATIEIWDRTQEVWRSPRPDDGSPPLFPEPVGETPPESVEPPPPPEPEPLAETEDPVEKQPTVPRSTLLIAGAIVVAGALIAWAIVSAVDRTRSSVDQQDRQYTMTGEIRAPECGGGYDLEGSAVEVRDQNDKLIGAATAGINQAGVGEGCTVEFSVRVPRASFYQLQFGTHGAPTYSFEDMVLTAWSLELTLGE